jgi:hypothetical protein
MALTEKIVAKARIHALLSYLRDVGERWCIAKWTSRVSEWVVRRAGLMFTESNDHGNKAESGVVITQQAHQDQDQDQDRQQQSLIDQGNHNHDQHPQNGNASLDQHLQFYDGNIPFDVNDILPDLWMQDFIGETFFGQLDEGLLMLNQI